MTQILTTNDLKLLINNGSSTGILLDPLLDNNQIGSISVDLRLGYDFLVSVNTRSPYISIEKNNNHRSTSSYFQKTRRDIGEKFLIYPGQLVLTTSLEYIRLPENIYAEVITRSSYNRLGIRISTTLQPGFRGCVPIEIANDSNNPVEAIVGSRFIQIKLYKISEEIKYENEARKYYGDVSPTSSRASEDKEIARLSLINQRNQ